MLVVVWLLLSYLFSERLLPLRLLNDLLVFIIKLVSGKVVVFVCVHRRSAVVDNLLVTLVTEARVLETQVACIVGLRFQKVFDVL